MSELRDLRILAAAARFASETRRPRWDRDHRVLRAAVATLASREPSSTKRDLKTEIVELLVDGSWRTTTEIATSGGGGIGARRSDVEGALAELVDGGAVEREVGPIGRQRSAVCFTRVVPSTGQPLSRASSPQAAEHLAEPSQTRRDREKAA